MLFGVIVGIYSTAFIAAPILIYLGVRTQTVEGRAGVRAEAEAS
jgi:preprotein translocase subunit SecF